MQRKTISIDDALILDLEREGVMARFKNFSELVSVSLRQTIDTIKKENYRKEIANMAQDPMVLQDIAEVEEDFQFADGEINAV